MTTKKKIGDKRRILSAVTEEEKNKNIRSQKDPYSRLFLKILYNLKMNHERWDRLMNRFLNDPSNNIPKNARKRSSERGNLHSALLDEQMSGKTFITGIKFLWPLKARITVDFDWPLGHHTSHSIVVFQRPENNDDDKDMENINTSSDDGDKQT